MKIFVYILSAYILWLIATPCIDEPDNGQMNLTEQSHNSHNDHQKGSNHCSPFCSCDCCLSPSVYQETIIHFSASFLKIKIFTAPLPNYFSISPSSVWQPPKFG
jgi:hypothetical protein